jgi:hypothetical protein
VEPLTVAAPIELSSPRELGRVDLTRAGSAIIEGNPFRVERRPTDVRFAGSPAPDASEPADQGQGVLFANVQLDGLIGGVKGTAVLSGVADFPGGIVISIGETRGDVTLLAIRNDSAVLTVSGQRVVLGMKVPNR